MATAVTVIIATSARETWSALDSFRIPQMTCQIPVSPDPLEFTCNLAPVVLHLILPHVPAFPGQRKLRSTSSFLPLRLLFKGGS